MELLQANPSADGSIQQEDEGILQTVPEEEDKERETTMRHMTQYQTDSYRAHNALTQLSLIPEEQPLRKNTMTGYSNALGASVQDL
jgi:hypothetical protein